ncbi:hypothetical protein GC163_19835 [bacterium]|nr:hypothetical protein [bacterium]
MDPSRSWLLTLGPIGLIGLCYVATAPASSSDWNWSVPDRPALPPRISAIPESYTEGIGDRSRDYPIDWPKVDAFPFLVTGNISQSQLTAVVKDVIQPTARALSIHYFDQPPAEPIVIVLLADHDTYRQMVSDWGHHRQAEYAGLYSRDDRRIVLNLATGEGTLAHELTHALAHADFPEMPEWFDEGLASLHEESQFSTDGLRLIGLPNWRDHQLAEAYTADSVPSVASLVQQPFGRNTHLAIRYALARNVCLYLQHQRLLGEFYRKSRAHISEDPTGGWTLLEITGCPDVETFDRRLKAWFDQRTATTKVQPSRPL